MAKGIVIVDTRRHSRESSMWCDTRRPKAHLDGFEGAIANLEGQGGTPGHDRRQHELDLAAVRSQATDLDPEVRKYQLLRSEALKSFEGGSLPGPTNTLVKARMGRGWAQRRLAEEMSMAAQQIRRGEAPGTHRPDGHGSATSRRHSAPRWAKASPLAPMRRDEPHGGSPF